MRVARRTEANSGGWESLYYIEDCETPTYLAITKLTGQSEFDGDLRLDFHRLPIQKIGAILPLTHRINRRLRENGFSAKDFYAADCAIFTDRRHQLYSALFALLQSDRRVRRRHSLHDQSLRDSLGHPHGCRRRFGNSRTGRD